MTVQIALKLDDAVVRELDELVGKGIYESRSDAVRRAVDRTLALHRRREIDEAFRAGFAADPDDEEVVAEAMRLGIAAIDEEPWDRWW